MKPLTFTFESLRLLGVGATMLLAACSASGSAGSGACQSGSFACQCDDGSSGTCEDGTQGACHCATATPDSGGTDSGGTSITTPSPLVGRWQIVSGTGLETCTDGESTLLPPNTAAVMTITQPTATTLEVNSSGAPDCTIDLAVMGDHASVLPGASCAIPGSGGILVYYTQFDLAPASPDAGVSSDGGNDSADGGDDAAPTAADSGAVSDGGSARIDRLDWQLTSRFTDPVKTCTSKLDYALVRAN